MTAADDRRQQVLAAIYADQAEIAADLAVEVRITKEMEDCIPESRIHPYDIVRELLTVAGFQVID